ncbi:hypothetical protein Lser_V15G28796 [Lactuca serriola]
MGIAEKGEYEGKRVRFLGWFDRHHHTMIPHKTKRGAAALARLKIYEGFPTTYNRTKRIVIHDALKVLRLTAGHKYCLLGQLSSEVGWNHYKTIKYTY